MEYRSIQFEIIETTNPYGGNGSLFSMRSERAGALGLRVLTPCWMPKLSLTRCYAVSRALKNNRVWIGTSMNVNRSQPGGYTDLAPMDGRST